MDDVDLYTGSMSEWPVNGGVVGDVNACLIGEQFMKTKYGDRFFWETEDATVGFNQGEIIISLLKCNQCSSDQYNVCL